MANGLLEGKKKKVEAPRNRFVDTVVKLFASGCYVGYLPVAPGTFGTIFGVAIYASMFAKMDLHLLAYFFIYLGWFLLGVFLTSLARDAFKTDEVNIIVFDKMLGGMIAVSAFDLHEMDVTFGRMVVTIGIYRLIEITKIFPLNQLEKLPKGWGQMADDVAGGVMALLISLFLPDWAWDFLQFKWPTEGL